MKFIKCLRKHNFADSYIGVVVYGATKPRFYNVDELIKSKLYLLNYRVLGITASITTTVDGKQVPAVLYYLGI